MIDDTLAMPFAASALLPLQQALTAAGASTEAAAEGTIAIAHAVYGFAAKADLDGSEFVPRHTDAQRSALAQHCSKLADHLLSAASGIDALKDTPIRGMPDAAYLIARQIGSARFAFGEAASPRVSTDLQFASYILGEFVELRHGKGLVVEPHCWPYRVHALVRDLPHYPSSTVQRVFADIAHDAEVLGVFLQAISVALKNKKGRRSTGAREMFASCIVTWLDATLAWPTGSEENDGPHVSLYGRIKPLWALAGPPAPEGASVDTFCEVLAVLRDSEALLTWRLERRLPPAKRRP